MSEPYPILSEVERGGDSIMFDIQVEEMEVIVAPKYFVSRDYAGQTGGDGFWTYNFTSGTWGWEPA